MAELATIARPYAEALFKAAGGDSAALVDEVGALALVAGDESLRRFADSPKFNADQVNDLVLSVMGGAVVFSGSVLPLLRFPLEFDYVHVTRYGDATSGGELRWIAAPRESIAGDFLEGTTREAFRIAHDVSSYSFAALAKGALPLLHKNASLLTLTYLGAVRVVPNYNTMGLAKASLEAAVRYLAASLGPRGIRVNGISAGPIKTLAAAGIGGFGKILKFVEQHAPLRRNVTIEEVGNVAAFLCSDLASGMTGEITYVDAGFNVTGIGQIE